MKLASMLLVLLLAPQLAQAGIQRSALLPKDARNIQIVSAMIERVFSYR